MRCFLTMTAMVVAALSILMGCVTDPQAEQPQPEPGTMASAQRCEALARSINSPLVNQAEKTASLEAMRNQGCLGHPPPAR